MTMYFDAVAEGIHELASVGSMGSYSTLLKKDINHTGIILASLNIHQTVAQKLLLDNGFEQVGDWVKNPNSSNHIALFVLYKKSVRTKKRWQPKHGEMWMDATPISCGIRRVRNIMAKPTQQQYDRTVAIYHRRTAIILATPKTKEARALFRKNGFKRYKRTALFIKHKEG